MVEFVGEHEMRKMLAEELGKTRGFNFPKMMKFLHRDIIGQGEMLKGPFGPKQMIYCGLLALSDFIFPRNKQHFFAFLETSFQRTLRFAQSNNISFRLLAQTGPLQGASCTASSSTCWAT